MYITITPNKVGGCSDLINYLDKENSTIRDFTNYLDKENTLVDEPDLFFNGDQNSVDKFEVADRIDKNCKGLSKDESRFFSLTINPSSKEINHIDSLAYTEALKINASGLGDNFDKMQSDIARNLYKEYAIQCMDNYAKNFEREGIKDNKDLVWYGKVEKDRYWKYNSYEVKENKKILNQIKRFEKKYPSPSELQIHKLNELKDSLIKESDIRKGGRDVVISEMMPKNGTNFHIHIVVSRRDKDQKVKLSPLAKARNNSQHKVGGRTCQVGFDRNKFVNNNEKTFDQSFDYSRAWAETYEARKLGKENPELYKEILKEKYIEENSYKKEPHNLERDIQDKDLDKTKDIANGIFNKFAQEAGLKYVAQARPYCTIIKTSIKGISTLRNSPQTEIAKKNIMSNYKLLSQSKNIAPNVAKKMFKQRLPQANPYVAVLSIIKSRLSADREIER